MLAADAERTATSIAAKSAADVYQIFTVAPSPKVLQKVRKAERIEGLSPTLSIWAEKHRVSRVGEFTIIRQRNETSLYNFWKKAFGFARLREYVCVCVRGGGGQMKLLMSVSSLR